MKNTILVILLAGSFVTVSAQNTKTSNGNQSNNVSRPALPVLQTYVPPIVVKEAVQKYGSALYCITQVRRANGQIAYMVGVIENGVLKSIIVDEEGKLAANRKQKPAVI